jgi:hypothetical protein
MTGQLPASVYPARLEVDYPEQHDRVTVLFRVFLIIPIGILIGVLTAGASQTVYNQSGQVVRNSSGGIARGPVPGDSADDRFQEALPALIVRLRPGTCSVRCASQRCR